MPKAPMNQNDFIKRMSDGLKLQAAKPNIFGYEPHTKQKAFHSSESKGRLYIGGNRSGKTTGGVVETIWWATGRHPYLVTPTPPVSIRVVGVDFVNGIEKILRPEMARWLPMSELKGGTWSTAYSKEFRTLTLENGSTIEYMSYDQDLDKFAGTSRHFIHFDEEPPEDIFIENKARLIDTGGSWIMTMTPVEGMTWIYDQVYLPGKNDPTSNISVIEIEMTENPYLSQSEVSEFIAGLSSEDRLARVKGKFVTTGGLVFKTFDPEKHVIDPMVPPSTWEWFLSLDHGYNAPTAALWHAVSPDGDVITFSEHYEAEKTVDYHASIIHMRNGSFGRVPDLLVADPALAQRNGVTGTSIFTEYGEAGLNFIPGNNDVLSGVNRMTTYLNEINGDGRPRWVITRNCQNLIWEMQRLRWKTYQTKKMAHTHNKLDQIHKKDDHACDSSRYFFTVIPDLRPNSLEGPKRKVGLQVPAYIPVSGRYDELLVQSLKNAKPQPEDGWYTESGTHIEYGAW